MTIRLNSLGPLKINTTVLPIVSGSLALGTVQEPSEHSGQLFPTLQLIRGQIPQLTAQIPFRAAYDLIGFTALDVTACEIYYARYTDADDAGAQGIKSTGTDHTYFDLATDAGALAVITGVSVAQDGLLLADIQVTFRAPDATTHPLVKNTDGTLPTLSTQPVIHTMGPVQLQGTVYDGIQDWSLDLAQVVEPVRTDGDLYPTTVLYRGGTPSFSVTTNNIQDTLANLDLIGETAASSIFYARQHDTTTGIVVGGATAISMTVARGVITYDTVDAAQQDLASAPLTITPVAAPATADTHPVVVSTGATAP